MPRSFLIFGQDSKAWGRMVFGAPVGNGRNPAASSADPTRVTNPRQVANLPHSFVYAQVARQRAAPHYL